MLIRTFIFRLVSILALISVLSAAEMTIVSSHLSVAFALNNNADENVELKNAASPAEGNTTLVRAGFTAKKTTEPKVSTIALRSGRHDDYLRVILEGPHKIISAGEVKRKDNVVSVTFSDARFSLNEKKLAIPYRRELNRILFTQFNLDKIRTHNLSQPSRLAIDFYVKKIAPDQLTASTAEIMPVKKVETGEESRSQPQIIEKNKTEQKRDVLEGTHISVGDAAEALKTVDLKEAEPDTTAPVPFMVVDIKTETVPADVKSVIDSTPLQSLPEVAVSEMQANQETGKIALLPFDNLSNNNDALDIIMPLILGQLENRGYDVLDYEEVEAYLCERRIRQTSILSREVARELGKNKMVQTIMTGALLTFSSEGNPKVGLLARLLDMATGQIIWADYVSLTGEDFTGILGLGTITSVDQLLPRAINRLFTDFGSTPSGPASEAKYKIAVLPFKNGTKQRHAGSIITHLFQNELAGNPMFEPLDFGNIKQTITDLRIRSKGEVDYHNLQELSKSLGVDVVLTGTVEEYRIGKSLSSPPSVTISARLLDSRRNRILWYDNLQLDGEENIIALDWGRLRSADKVAYGAVSGLVENMESNGLLQ